MKTTTGILVAVAVCTVALAVCANDTDYGPFGSSDDWTYEAGNKDKTAIPVIGLSSGIYIGARKAAEGDCIAAYRKDKNVICALGRVDSSGRTGLKFEVDSGVKVHFKLWIASSGAANPEIFDIDSACDFTILATDLPTVDLGELVVTVPKVFGPGEVSNFEVEGAGEAVLVGVSEVAWRDFSCTDYYGTKMFVDENIVDAEKTAKDDNDDYWCYPMSDMNALYLTGWYKNTSYATVDDMVAYFRKNPRLLRYEQYGEVREGTYGFVENGDWGDFFDWYKNTANIDLADVNALTEGFVGASFLAELRGLLDDGSHVVRLNVDFDNVVQNEKWKWYAVSHGVLCVGYVADGDVLKALFIIDPDNNQYTGAGGAGAPNSIMYCPVAWDDSTESYTISGVWGQDGTLLPEYRALSVMPVVYTVVFDKNGGTGKMASQKFPEGAAQALFSNMFTKSGFMFAGWRDQDGNEYADGEEIVATRDMTLYAHWRKMFKVAVKDGGVSEDEENYAAGIMAFNGTGLYLQAADKSDKDMAFGKWTVSPASADLGPDFNPRDSRTLFTMPEAGVSFTANYIARPGYVAIATFEQNATANKDDEPQGIEWSDDGKVWTSAGDGIAYPVKAGRSVAIQFRSIDPRWTVPARVNCKIEAGETTKLEVAATRVAIVETEAELEQPGASGTVAMAPKSGQVLSGKPVTLTARPGKDTVFAYWMVDGEKVGYAATFKFAPDVDSTARAVFRLKSAVEEPVLDMNRVVPSANAMVGVAFDMSIPLADAAYPAKFTASRLPSGLKIDAASGTIGGVPTKAGDYQIVVTATGGAKAKSSITLPIEIKPLPEWAQGTFTGCTTAYGNGGADDFADAGLATLAVTSAGKVSGKVSLCGTNWTFSASSYDAATRTGASGENPGEEEEFVIATEMKSGKIVKPLHLAVTRAISPLPGGEALQNAYVSGWTDSETESFELCRTMWKDKSTASASKAVLATWEGVWTLSLDPAENYGSGDLSLTVGKDGAVKATGKLADGTGVSATSPLMYDEDKGGFFAYLYSAPSAYKGGSFAVEIGFEGGEETLRVLYGAGVAQWKNLSAEATGEYGNGFERVLECSGAYYDKLQKLNEYYDALRLSMMGSPMLSYTFRSTFLDDDTGRKITESWLDEADPTDTSDQDGLIVAVDDKGRLIVAKATKPVQDRETKEWIYEGANDGALALSFTQATGIFKGSYTFWYDYMSAYDDIKDSATMLHTSKKVSFEGIMVQGEHELRGFYLWDATGLYEDEKTRRRKTYKYKISYPVLLQGQ